MRKNKPNNYLKIMATIFIFVIILAGSELYFGIAGKHWFSAAPKIDGVYLSQSQAISDFQLTDNHGQNFTKENLKNHWTMVFFGFTNCGDVCPITMAALNKMYHQLQSELPPEKLPQVVMISVDPDRDSVARMNDYVTSFNPAFHGARGDIGQTIALEKQLHIAAAKLIVGNPGDQHYTIDHSAEILVFNPDGELQAFLSYPHDAAQMVKDYQAIYHYNS